MNRHVEGTMELNGLIEGPLPDDAGAEDRLRDWVRGMREMGVVFHLEVTSGAFSLLPSNDPWPSQPLGDVPHESLSQALEQLLEPFPAELARRVTSTLRSSEYRKGEEVQTVYLNDGGTIRREQRTVAAETEAPPQPISPKEIARTLAIGAVVAAALLGITSLFVDVPGLARQLIGTVRPIRADDIEIDVSAYGAFFTVEKKEVAGDALRITLRRTDKFPLTDEALQQAADEADDAIKERLAVAAIARGYVRCDIHDSDGKFVTWTTVRIAGLRDDETIVVHVPLKTNTRFRPGKIVFAL